MTKLNQPETLIKKILDERGIKQNFICQKTGIHPKILEYCMSGKRKLEVWEFIAICDLLHLDFSIFKDCFENICPNKFYNKRFACRNSSACDKQEQNVSELWEY